MPSATRSQWCWKIDEKGVDEITMRKQNVSEKECWYKKEINFEFK